MSLKAGRVGVNPADVDPINGHISPESVDSYTKVQADAKFETQTAATSEHALLQPKTLAVPIHMLNGSKLTVEGVLQELSSIENIVTLAEGFTVVSSMNLIRTIGKVVELTLRVSGDFTAWSEIGSIPISLIPKFSNSIPCVNITSNTATTVQIGHNGKILAEHSFSDSVLHIHALWFIE